MTDKPAVALYLRSAVQNDDAVAEQLQLCEAHAATQGWSVGDIFTDNGASGMRDDHPGMVALRECIRSARASSVLAVEPSRFFRDPDLLMAFAHFCRGHGATIAYVEPRSTGLPTFSAFSFRRPEGGARTRRNRFSAAVRTLADSSRPPA